MFSRDENMNEVVPKMDNQNACGFLMLCYFCEKL